MKLNQLRNFTAVVDAGTVRQAAKNLNLSQSSVTKSIQQLEDDLGVELLHRSAHGVAPTEAGKALLARAKTIEAELRHARNDVEAIQGLAGKIDAIALEPGRPRDETLSFISLVKDRLVPAVRADHPLIGRRKLGLADLIELDWIIYRRSHTGLDVFEQTFITNGLEPPKSTIECTSFACALALVENGDYVTLVPSQIFAGNRKTPSITPVLLDSPMQPWQVAVISRAKHELSAVCLAFLAELQKTAAKIDLPMSNVRRAARLRP